jgi:nitroreductase
MDVMPAIQQRFSAHAFLPDPVSPEALERILEAGRRAPSAKNRQPWRFVVIQQEEHRRRIQDAAYNEPGVGQAPVIIAICSTNIDYRMPNGQLAYPVDLSFAAAYMELQAVHEGLGCCINTTFQEDDVRDLLTVPYSMRVVVLLVIGHPAEKRTGEPNRLPRTRIVSFEHW